MKLAFHIIARGRCTVRQPSSRLIRFTEVAVRELT